MWTDYSKWGRIYIVDAVIDAEQPESKLFCVAEPNREDKNSFFSWSESDVKQLVAIAFYCKKGLFEHQNNF